MVFWKFADVDFGKITLPIADTVLLAITGDGVEPSLL